MRCVQISITLNCLMLKRGRGSISSIVKQFRGNGQKGDRFTYSCVDQKWFSN